MKTSSRRWSAVGIAAGLFTLITGCVTTDDGYGGSYSVGYYDTYGYDYGHWRAGYQVGPPGHEREGHERVEQHPARAESHPSTSQSKPAYRPAPSSHPAPSIPSRPRSHSH